MLTEADMQTRLLHAHEAENTPAKPGSKLLRAAEARHRLELLREARSLHDHLADVWDPQFKPAAQLDA
jgi:hypothetical protein